MQLVAKGDLTGTKVTSDKPVSVFSGNKKTTVGPGNSSDHLVEHIIPVDYWGKNFITTPIPQRTVVDYFRFIANEDNTTVAISGGFNSSFTINAGEFKEESVPSNAYCKMTSDKALMLVQFSLSGHRTEKRGFKSGKFKDKTKTRVLHCIMFILFCVY